MPLYYLDSLKKLNAHFNFKLNRCLTRLTSKKKESNEQKNSTYVKEIKKLNESEQGDDNSLPFR